jgi:hypothetical protein
MARQDPFRNLPGLAGSFDSEMEVEAAQSEPAYAQSCLDVILGILKLWRRRITM